MTKKSTDKKITESAAPDQGPVSDREKYLAEIKTLTEQLKETDTAWALMKGLESSREMLMLAIAERKGIIAYLNKKGI